MSAAALLLQWQDREASVSGGNLAGNGFWIYGFLTITSKCQWQVDACGRLLGYLLRIHTHARHRLTAFGLRFDEWMHGLGLEGAFGTAS
jgi:hypothetical protein